MVVVAVVDMHDMHCFPRHGVDVPIKSYLRPTPLASMHDDHRHYMQSKHDSRPTMFKVYDKR